MIASAVSAASRSLMRQQLSSTSLRRVGLLRPYSSSSSIFQKSTITSKLPLIKLSGETTLGDLRTKGFVTYKYRAVYPLLLWVAFLYSYLWFPYVVVCCCL